MFWFWFLFGTSQEPNVAIVVTEGGCAQRTSVYVGGENVVIAMDNGCMLAKSKSAIYNIVINYK